MTTKVYLQLKLESETGGGLLQLTSPKFISEWTVVGKGMWNIPNISNPNQFAAPLYHFSPSLRTVSCFKLSISLGKSY